MLTHKVNSILYVEDDRYTREELKSFLEDFCTTLYIVSNGLEGLELFKKKLC